MSYTIHKTSKPHRSSFSSRISKIFAPITFIVSLLWKIVSLASYLLPHKFRRKLNSTQRLFLNVVLAGIFIVFGVWIYTSFINPAQSQAAWFNQNWLYRQTVPVSNNGSKLENAQMPITVDTASLISAGKMRSDCRDVRVTLGTGKLLKHWVHNCNTDSTVIYAWAFSIPSGSSTLFLYYGNSTASQNTEVRTGTQQYPGISCKTILDHGDSSGNGTYIIDPNAGQLSDAFSVSCDMTTDSGGWTVVNSSNGTINQQPLTSNTEVSGNPFSNQSSNISTQKKQDLSLVSSESLFKRSTGVWLKASVPIFDGNLTTPSQHPHNTGVTLTANDGTQVTTAVTGYSNYNNSNGGDYGITTSVGFDHHNTSTYYHLRSGCSNHYLYRYGSTYNVNTALGSWTQTTACSNNSTAMGPWYAAMRGTITPTVTNITVSSPTNEEQSNGPVGYWKFDEGTGSTVGDSTRSGINGTVNGATWAPESQCLSGRCLYFDGDDYVDLGDPARLGKNRTEGAVTIMAWIKVTELPKINVISNGVGPLSYFAAGTGSNGHLRTMVYEDDATNFWPESSQSINANEWVHVAYVFEHQVGYKFYINGRLVTNTPNTHILFHSYYSYARLGYGFDANTYFKGWMDEVKVYPYARNDAQIQADFSSRGSVKGTSVGIGGDNNSTLTNGLVGYWKMDEASWNGTSGEVIDSSGNGNHGTATNAITRSGKFGNGGSFDGTGDGVNVGTGSTLTGLTTSGFTVSAWVKKTGSGAKPIIGRWDESTGDRIWTLELAAAGYDFTTSSDGSFQSGNRASSGISTSGQWIHIVGVYEGTYNKIYINGEEAGKIDRSNDGIHTDNTIPLQVGFSPQQFGSSNVSLDGSVDEVRIYNRALSPAEVSQLYNYAPGPVGYWNFENEIGTTLTDKSGNGGTGTWAGTGRRWTQGKFGTGGDFNGTNDYIDLDNPPSISSSNITVGAWVKVNNLSGTQAVVSKAGSGASDKDFLLNIISGAPSFAIFAGSTGYTLSANTSILPNKWYYIAGSWDGTTIRIYVDGILQGTLTPGVTKSTTTYDLLFGRRNFSSVNLNGQMDEIRIYNYARTPKQIIEDMNAGHPAGGSPVASQTLYYKFDEGYGSTVNNSGNAPDITGTLSGATWSNDGKFGRALYFNGASNVSLNNESPTLQTDNKTITFWANPSAAPSAFQGVFYGGLNYYIGVNTSNRIFISYGNSSNAQKTASSSNNTLIPNEWHHYAVSFEVSGSNVTVSFYRDGKFINSSTQTDGYGTTYSSSFYLGGAFNSSYFTGYLDEMKFYSSTLTASEIQIDYNRNSSLVLGAAGTSSSDGKTASSSASTLYCIPGDTSTCSPPVAEWKFDEKTGTTVNDTSGNGYSGTFGSQSKWARGKIGSALDVDGSGVNSSVSMGDNLDLIGSPISVSVWVYPRSFSTAAGIIDKLASGGNWRVAIANTSGKIQFGIRSSDSTFQGATSTSTLPLNQWSFITTTYDNSSTAKIYINGKLDATNTGLTLTRADISTFLRIGYTSNNAVAFNGLIDEVKIYNYVRTPAQVAWDYNRGGPVAHYKMDECQGSTLNDASGNGHRGTINIDASGTQTSVGTCQTAGTAWGNGVSGKYNSSLNLDGSDEYITISDSPLLDIGTGDFTFSAWIKKPSGGKPSPGIISKNGSPGYRFVLNGSNMGLGIYNGTIWTTYYSTGANIQMDTWQHLVVTADRDGNATFYVNGKRVSSSDISGTSTVDISNTSDLRLGDDNWCRSATCGQFDGQIDDIQIFNYALTSTQIRNLMNQGGAVRFGPSQGTP